ncbi:MAG: hypothetical protein ACI915_001250 [Gammaproteobacteria bacterium]|jgi:hypothetical protein
MFTKPTAPRPAQQQIFGSDLLSQLDPNDPLLLLSRVIDWSRFENEFAQYYNPDKGRPAIPIRRLGGLLFVKLLENLSDESVVLGYRRIRTTRYFVVRLSLIVRCRVARRSCVTFANASAHLARNWSSQSQSAYMAVIRKTRKFILILRYTTAGIMVWTHSTS